jgi:hypothetical protein
MDIMRLLPPAILLAVLMAACSSRDTVGPADSAAGEPPITTDAQAYTLVADEHGFRTEIAIRFRNVTPRKMYIVNCHQILAPTLEKRVGDAWQPFWHGSTPLCLTPPIVIRAGDVLERTLRIWGSVPPASSHPQFASPDVEGTYRLVLHAVVFAYNPDREGFGEPVPLQYRVSNEFTLHR